MFGISKNEKLVLGVDGGGTKSDFYIFSTSGNFISKTTGGPTNHEVYSGGFYEMTDEFESILTDALKSAKVQISDISAAVLGMAGIDIPSQKSRMEKYLHSLGIKKTLVFNDSFLGIKAACPSGYGVCFVNGTGNSVGGIDPAGNWLQVGGTGEAFGDLGGAAGMTNRVICAVYSSFYRCGPKTQMSDLLFSLLQIDNPALLTQSIYDSHYSGYISHTDIHNEVLYTAANNGDKVANNLLISFGKQFALSIAGCINNLNYDSPDIDIALVGSATLKAQSNKMMETCKTEIELLTKKNIYYYPLTVSPAVGAVLWAIELANGNNKDNSLKDIVIKSLNY